jgi:hypothetical protein
LPCFFRRALCPRHSDSCYLSMHGSSRWDPLRSLRTWHWRASAYTRFRGWEYMPGRKLYCAEYIPSLSAREGVSSATSQMWPPSKSASVFRGKVCTKRLRIRADQWSEAPIVVFFFFCLVAEYILLRTVCSVFYVRDEHPQKRSRHERAFF